MASQSMDLAKIFGTVAKTMMKNQTTLNEADTYNHDHGDNMVQIFEVITQAMKEKKEASPADQLAYASQILRNKSQSGSAQIYAEGLSDASSQFKGVKKITPDNMMVLLQALLGAQGSVAAPSAAPSADAGSDLLGGLLGTLTGMTTSAPTQQTEAQAPQVDLGQLLNAGMAFAQSKQAGGSNLDAILNAVVSSSKMSSSQHRSQSGTLVADALMQAIGKMATKAK